MTPSKEQFVARVMSGLSERKKGKEAERVARLDCLEFSRDALDEEFYGFVAAKKNSHGKPYANFSGGY